MLQLSGDVVAQSGEAVTVRSAQAAESGSVWWAVGDGSHCAVRLGGCDAEGQAFLLGAHRLPVEPTNAVASSWIEFVNGSGAVRKLPAYLDGASDGMVELRVPSEVPTGEVVYVSGPNLGVLGKIAAVSGSAANQKVSVDIWTEAR